MEDIYLGRSMERCGLMECLSMCDYVLLCRVYFMVYKWMRKILNKTAIWDYIYDMNRIISNLDKKFGSQTFL